jgi:hypothetical protein
MNAAIEETTDSKNLNHLFRSNSTCVERDPLIAVQKIRAHIVMRKQARFLEDIPDRTFIERQTVPAALILPHLLAELHKALRGPFESRQTSQQRGLA